MSDSARLGILRTHHTRRRLPRLAAIGLVVGALVVTGAPAITPAAALASCPGAFPVGQVKAGMTGVGLTVSSGQTPEQFTYTAKGVLADGVAPGIDMIIIEADSTAIRDAGGIWAGMSGSPVYAGDGRLLGAVAYGLSFGPSRTAGVTPAAQMYKLLSLGAPATTSVKGSVALPRTMQERLTADGAATAVQASGGLSRLRTPVSVSGLTDGRMSVFDDSALAKRLGPAVSYRGAAVRAGATATATTIRPGGNFAEAVSYGDITIAGTGTTTAVCSGRALAFGHPLTALGALSASAHAADALYIQADPLGAPYKVANLGGVVGTVDQDRVPGIRAVLGPRPPSTPIVSDVDATTGFARHGRTLANVDRFLPDVAFFHLLANLDAVLLKFGEGTSLVDWTATGTRPDGSTWQLTRRNRFASQFDISFESAFELNDDLFRIENNPFQPARVDTVTMTAHATELFTNYELTKVLVKRGDTYVVPDPGVPVRVRAGSNLTVRSILTPYRGEGSRRVIDMTFAVPADAAGQFGSVNLTGAAEEPFAATGEPNSFNALLRDLRTEPRNDQLVGTLSFGDGTDPAAVDTVRNVRTLDRVVNGFASFDVEVRPAA